MPVRRCNPLTYEATDVGSESIVDKSQSLKAHSDWLLKLRISFAIHLRATCTGFAPKTVVIVAGIKKLKSAFCATIHLNVRWLVVVFTMLQSGPLR